MTATDPTLCPGTWPQPVGHTHVCIRTVGHRGQCECLCGSVADSELLEPTTEDPMTTDPTTAAPAAPGQLDLDAIQTRAELETERARWGHYKRQYLGALDITNQLRAELAEANTDLKAVRAEAERLRTGEHLASCVWVDPGRMSGAPCLGGTRITVDTIAGLLADGLDGDQIRGVYPAVTDEHLAAVTHFVENVVDDDWANEVDRLNAEVTTWKTRLVNETADLRTELATARRDAAADGVLLAKEILPDGVAAHEDLEELSDQIRTGQRDTPGTSEEGSTDA